MGYEMVATIQLPAVSPKAQGKGVGYERNHCKPDTLSMIKELM